MKKLCFTTASSLLGAILMLSVVGCSVNHRLFTDEEVYVNDLLPLFAQREQLWQEWLQTCGQDYDHPKCEPVTQQILDLDAVFLETLDAKSVPDSLKKSHEGLVQGFEKEQDAVTLLKAYQDQPEQRSELDKTDYLGKAKATQDEGVELIVNAMADLGWS